MGFAITAIMLITPTFNFNLILFRISKMFRLLFIIGTGSFVGGIARFLVTRFIQNKILSAFPYGTFVVNIVGCLLIGLFYGIYEKGNFLTSEWRMFLTVGFCGGFTTFSTFSNENFLLLNNLTIENKICKNLDEKKRWIIKKNGINTPFGALLYDNELQVTKQRIWYETKNKKS